MMDDFSFPAVQKDEDHTTCNLPFPHFMASPLWFMSSVSDEKAGYRRSFSSADDAARISDTLNASTMSDDEGAVGQFVSSEEKMDMLWEDFNEELHRMSCEWKMESEAKKGGSMRGFGVPKDRGSLLPHRRPSLVVMLKVLKKLFLVQKSGSTRKKAASIYKM